MNVEIGAEAALLPEKEYISGIFVALYGWGGGGSQKKPSSLLSLVAWQFWTKAKYDEWATTALIKNKIKFSS